MGMDILSKRKELALFLLKELKDNYARISTAAQTTALSSVDCYDEAVEEMKDELRSILDDYNRNIDQIREINKMITSSINSWYEYVKNEEAMSMLTFPIEFRIRKKKLYKQIESLNKQISEITISNRFLKEKLTAAGLELEIRAVRLAHNGESYNEYEKLLSRKKDIESELEYLLPTIPGLCPADITSAGIDATIEAAEKMLQPLS